MKNRFRHLAAACTAAVLGLGTLSALPGLTTAAATNNWKFDLGAVAQSGYTSVGADVTYDKSRGYGFSGSGVSNQAANGKGAQSDAVKFEDNTTFNVDLDKGLYRVTVTLGNTTRTSVYMENMLQIVNMTGDGATDTILIPITDGQLNIRAAAGKAGYAFTISEIDIEQVSTDPTYPATIWFCGDSTVCNYYPKDTSAQAGWGQVFDQFIDTSAYQVRDMAASGQYAAGFVNAGQFDAIEAYGKAGDFYIISIGINDTNYSNKDEYYNVVTDMVMRAKAKGMNVVLVKQQGRCQDVKRDPPLPGRWFGDQLDKIGAEQNVQVIDLFTPWQDFGYSLGYDAFLDYYMPDDDLHPNRKGAMKLAEIAAGLIDWSGTGTGAELDTEGVYQLRNVNSGLVMSVENGVGENRSNVVQSGAAALQDGNLWHFRDAGEGYYQIYSMLDGGESWLLDLNGGKAVNGTNITLWENTNTDAQLYKFRENEDGSYTILTKSSGSKSAVEVKDASSEEGANVQEWELNGHNCQSWRLEWVSYPTPEQADGILGDLTGDGRVNGFDLALMRSFLLEKAAQETPAPRYGDAQINRFGDTDADGDVTLTDAVTLKQFLLEQESLPAIRDNKAFYYAEDMAFSQGMHEQANAGFKGRSYVNLNNMVGSFIEWHVNAPQTGNYLCSFGIANGAAENRQMKIEVNGQSEYWMQDFLTTESWTQWAERGIVLPLNAGENVIRLTSATAGGGPNFDYLRTELTDEPVAETYIPPTDPDPQPTGGTTIYIAGDSTVQTYRADKAPQQGWGAYLGDYVPDTYTISNHAIAGRSSKSFYDNGRLQTILDAIQPGDYLLVQFAINDADYTKTERYAPVSDSIPGTDGSFEYYIAKYIEGAKEKGATPVLVTTVLGLKAYSNGKFVGSYSNYCDAMKKMAAYYDIPCIDLNSMMVDHYNAIGYDKAYTYHLISTELSDTDMTHFTETGAAAVAKLVGDALVAQGILK